MNTKYFSYIGKWLGKVAAIVLCIIVLSGCASTMWVRSVNDTQQAWDSDYAQSKYEGTMGYGYRESKANIGAGLRWLW